VVCHRKIVIAKKSHIVEELILIFFKCGVRNSTCKLKYACMEINVRKFPDVLIFITLPKTFHTWLTIRIHVVERCICMNKFIVLITNNMKMSS